MYAFINYYMVFLIAVYVLNIYTPFPVSLACMRISLLFCQRINAFLNLYNSLHQYFKANYK